MRKTILAIGFILLCFDSAWACLAYTGACPSPIPAPDDSIPLDRFAHHGRLALATCVVLLIWSCIIVGRKTLTIPRLFLSAYGIAIASILLVPFLKATFVSISSCGCVSEQPFLKIGDIFGRSGLVAFLLLSCLVLAGAAVIRTTLNVWHRTRQPASAV
jgi:hypothetical protein